MEQHPTRSMYTGTPSSPLGIGRWQGRKNRVLHIFALSSSISSCQNPDKASILKKILCFYHFTDYLFCLHRAVSPCSPVVIMHMTLTDPSCLTVMQTTNPKEKYVFCNLSSASGKLYELTYRARDKLKFADALIWIRQ